MHEIDSQRSSDDQTDGFSLAFSGEPERADGQTDGHGLPTGRLHSWLTLTKRKRRASHIPTRRRLDPCMPAGLALDSCLIKKPKSRWSSGALLGTASACIDRAVPTLPPNATASLHEVYRVVAAPT